MLDPLPDHYGTLGVPPDADEATVREAFRLLVRATHPDQSHDPATAARLREIVQAYQVLRDPARRAAYDVQRRDRRPPPAPVVQAAYAQAEALGPRRPRPTRTPPPKGRPRRLVPLTISFWEAVFGTTRTVALGRPCPCRGYLGRPANACRRCRGSGFSGASKQLAVEVPAWARHGQQLPVDPAAVADIAPEGLAFVVRVAGYRVA